MRPSSLVSVIVATRNRPDLLRECLDGVAAQDHQAVEVLVVDDGSSQATLDAYANLCPALADRVRWLLPEHPDSPGTGPAAARNRGLRAATGTFVAFCDDDDRWIQPDHLSCGTEALEEAKADFFFTDVVAGRDGTVSDFIWFPERQRLQQGHRVLDGRNVFAVDLSTVLSVVGGTVIHPDCWIVRKALLDDIGGFWERLWFPEDYDLMMRVLDRARAIAFRSDACVYYRLPVVDSHSLKSSLLETTLQAVMAAQHVRFRCRSRIVRRHARAREAWALRVLAGELRARGDRQAGRLFAWQGLCLYPTLGALRDWLAR